MKFEARRWAKSVVVALGLIFVAGGRVGAQPPPPQDNATAEPWSPKAAGLASRAVAAELSGDSRTAVALADDAIRANPRDPWPYYDKGMALAHGGETDAAVAALVAAEQHFAPGDRAGIAVAKYGRAHVLNEAGRCREAREAFNDYAAFVESDDKRSADLARRYASECAPPRPSFAAPAARPTAAAH